MANVAIATESGMRNGVFATSERIGTFKSVVFIDMLEQAIHLMSKGNP